MTDQTPPPPPEPLELYLRLLLTPGVGPRTFRKLHQHFGSLQRALQAPPPQLAQVPGLGLNLAQRIAQARDKTDPHTEIARARDLGIDIITLDHPQYPLLLRNLPDAPPVLYLKGRLLPADNLALAIVGSRTPTHYGLEQAARFASLLAAAGFTIVSGLARGIDAAAHQAALAADGRTLAVQGCGLAHLYPTENAQLAQLITNSGAIISELPLNTAPAAANFPARNRIIAALALATLVIEAKPRSGALITARLALEYHREVLALPGRIDNPNAQGPHQLIRDGAALVTSLDDVLEALGPIGGHLQNQTPKAQSSLFDQPQSPIDNLPQHEQILLRHLSHEPTHVDDLVAASQCPVAQVHAALTALQIKALARQHPGNLYTRR